MNKFTLTRDVARSRQDFDFADIARSLWRGKFVVLACLVLSVFLTAQFLRNTVYRYTAELKVTPPSTTSTSLSGALSQLGQVAALAGIGGIANNDNTSAFQLYLEGLLLRETAETLSANPEIMKAVFKGEWNETEGRWQEPPATMFTPTYLELRRWFGVPIYAWQPPDAARLHDYIKRSIRTIQGVRSPVATITFKHDDPKFAVTFLTALNETVDAALRKKMLERTSQYIAYLSQALRTVTVAEHRLALVQALSEQEKFRMMASSSAPYAADVFGGPMVSSRPTDPRPFYVLLIMIAGGLVMGGLLARAIYPGRGAHPLPASVDMA